MYINFLKENRELYTTRLQLVEGVKVYSTVGIYNKGTYSKKSKSKVQ